MTNLDKNKKLPTHAPARHFTRPGAIYHGRTTSFSVGTVLIIVVLIIGTLLFPKDSSTHVQLVSAEQQSELEEDMNSVDLKGFGNQVETIISQHSEYDISVSLVDIKTGQTYSYGVEDPYVAASTAKILTSVAFLHYVELGDYSLSDLVNGVDAKTGIAKMIIDSDNPTWKAFNNDVLTHAQLAQYAQNVGFVGYNPDENTATSRSMAMLLSELYQGKLLNQEHTKLMLNYMEQAKEIDYITSHRTDDIKIYHKAGYLSDRVNDASIIDNGKRPFTLIIFSKSRLGTYDTATARAYFSQIASEAITAFEGH